MRGELFKFGLDWFWESDSFDSFTSHKNRTDGLWFLRRIRSGMKVSWPVPRQFQEMMELILGGRGGGGLEGRK